MRKHHLSYTIFSIYDPYKQTKTHSVSVFLEKKEVFFSFPKNSRRFGGKILNSSQGVVHSEVFADPLTQIF